MNRFPFVISILIGLFASTASFPWADLDLYIRTQREVRCKDEEYRSGNICCLKCPAGTHLKSACTTPGEVGQCEECEDGTHTQHANDFTRCSRCTLCRSDQVIFRPCSHTQDAECHCKAGGFCDPEEACETCIKCSSCEKDKEVVRNCTATSNTECKEIPTQSNSSSGIVEAIAIIVSVLVLGIVGACIFCCMKKRARGSVGNESKAELHVQDGRNEQTQRGCSGLTFAQSLVRVQSASATVDECQALCESRNSSASSSQQNLTSLPPALATLAAPAQRPCQPDLREDEPFPELIPVNGVDSLRKCFEYFEEVDIDYYKRFFRELDLHGNVIRSKDQLTYEDRIHELLNIWVEKEGKDASLNDLLKALLKFDQRRTAETIKEKALENGHYVLASKSF
ncbi:hematopoietic death receptor isoform X2 [Syngnathus typhle]|uniref:hematopoietic death receptor isoform X2 n=1 Tax=Syngnathus typhle TaxID=161592 RepID=UPI002A6A4843|nr:hematopoietic death receptor isoform X2 [Syngnathus typhle]